MRGSVRSMWALAILAGVGVSAWAQPPGPPGGPGGPGGPFGGGFGGGRGGFPGMGGGGDAFLLMMPEVQKELGITEDQQALLQEMMDDLRNSMPRPDFAALRDLGEEERRQKMEEVRKQGEERMKQAEDALKVILDEKQFARHGELRLQRQGVMALTRPEVADKLQLTDEQKTKLNEIRDANMAQGGFGGRGGRGPGGPGGPGGGPRGPEGAPGAGGPGGGAPGAGPGGPRPDFQAMMAEMQKRREKIEADVLAVLTPEQKTAWEGMLGKKFDFPAPQFGGGRGPGGPGGPGGNRGGRPPAE